MTSATAGFADRRFAPPHAVAAERVMSKLAWYALFLPVLLFTWGPSHFQYDVYLPENYQFAIYSASVAALLFIAAIAWWKRYPRLLVRVVVAYISLCALHVALDTVLSGEAKMVQGLQASVVAVLLLPVLSSRRALRHFIGLNFTVGTILIALNTVPVLHWLGVISLPYRQVRRVGGAPGLFELDPLHFGVFGLTENLVVAASPIPVARLQGFSLEPIHWSYFVFLTIGCALLLLATRSRRPHKLLVGAISGLIAVHLFFVFSTVAFITTVAWACCLLAIWIIRHRPLSMIKETFLTWLILVITPGLMIPFMIATIPNLDMYLAAEDVLREGANWESKVGFLSLGAQLYTRFFPTVGEPPAAGHNLLLFTYLKYGYFLTIPLLAFLWFVIRHGSALLPMLVIAAAAVFVLANTIVVPLQLFYPSGAVLILVLVAVGYHFRRGAWRTRGDFRPA